MAENPHPPKAPDQENTKMHVLVSDLGGYTPKNAYKNPTSTILQHSHPPYVFFFFALGVHNIATVYKWVVGKWLSTPRDRFRLWPEVRARSGQHAKYPRVPWSKNCMSNGWAKTRLLTMCDHLFCWFLGVILSHDWCNQLFFGEQEKISGEFTTCCKH